MSVLFPEDNEVLPRPSVPPPTPPMDATKAGNPGPVVPSPMPAQPPANLPPALPPPNPSHQAYQVGLDAFLKGNDDAALHAWSLSKEPEAKMGLQRIMDKRKPPPPIHPQSLGAYRDGLISFLDGDVESAKKAWGSALQMDPNNRAAHMGLQRISRGQ